MIQQDVTALFKASYGLYLLSAKDGERDNACIINTFLQITSNLPVGCLISINKQNLTTEIISKTLKFNLSVLTVETPFELLKRFGYQSGHNVDKFKDFNEIARSENDLTFLTSYANAFLSFDVIDIIDYNSHNLLKATLTECKTLNQKESLTYDYYQRNIKPKPQADIKAGYRCNICGYVHNSETLPSDFICPLCNHGASNFQKI